MNAKPLTPAELLAEREKRRRLKAEALTQLLKIQPHLRAEQITVDDKLVTVYSATTADTGVCASDLITLRESRWIVRDLQAGTLRLTRSAEIALGINLTPRPSDLTVEAPASKPPPLPQALTDDEVDVATVVAALRKHGPLTAAELAPVLSGYDGVRLQLALLLAVGLKSITATPRRNGTLYEAAPQTGPSPGTIQDRILSTIRASTAKHPLTPNEIATRTGLGLRQVRAGVAALDSRGLIMLAESEGWRQCWQVRR